MRFLDDAGDCGSLRPVLSEGSIGRGHDSDGAARPQKWKTASESAAQARDLRNRRFLLSLFCLLAQLSPNSALVSIKPTVEPPSTALLRRRRTIRKHS